MRAFRSIATSILRGRRTIVAGPVRYRERSAESLATAFSARGRGHKDYDAFFPDAAAMRIRCTPQRQYADVVDADLLAPYRLADPFVRPGMRVLDARSGTGFGAADLSARVGASGAVVALDPDHESVRFARRRYPTGNVSFEIGGADALSGELDGSFDVVIGVHALRTDADNSHTLAGLWRVLAPGAPMVLVQPMPETDAPRFGPPKPARRRPGWDRLSTPPLRLSSAELRNVLAHLDPEPQIEPTDAIDRAAIVARKPAPPHRDRPPPAPPPYPPMR